MYPKKSLKKNQLYQFNKSKNRLVDSAYLFDSFSQNPIRIKNKEYILFIKEITFEQSIALLIMINNNNNNKIIAIDKHFFTIYNELTPIY